MGAQGWIYAFLLYFFFIFATLAIMTPILTPSITIDASGLPFPSYQTNSSLSTTVPESTSPWSVGSYFKVVFAFFVWDQSGTFSLGTGNALAEILLKTVFVYLPLLFLTLAIYYSLPTVSG